MHSSAPPPYSFEPDPNAPRAPATSSSAAPASSTLLSGKHPHPYGAGAYLTADPRSSSTQSLLPSSSSESLFSPSTPSSSADPHHLGYHHHQHTKRRKLLIIYIHGFLGNDQSFRSFPAHVHALLSNMLVESHVIHSKIYPRYKTYRSVDVARDNFSAWLRPHESTTTDVVLVGHSMGGILAADVVLMKSQRPNEPDALNHRILGHISLDCPFLGLHHGIIVSGISSLFKPAATPQDQHLDTNANKVDTSTVASPNSSSMNLTASNASAPGSPLSPSLLTSDNNSRLPSDMFFNQPFFNDAGLREQPFVRRMLHFASKYRSEGIVQSAARHVLSYLEFGGCLADPAGLETRYCRLRALEDVDELQPFGPGRDPRGPQTQVRFVNYYTLCNGRPKSPKLSKSDLAEEPSSPKDSTDILDITSGVPSPKPPSSTLQEDMERQNHVRESPRESPRPVVILEDRGDGDGDVDDFTLLDPIPVADDIPTPPRNSHGITPKNDEPATKTESLSSSLNHLALQPTDTTPVSSSPAPLTSTDSASLPPIPSSPTPPALPNLDLYTDKDERKQAEREAKRLQRAYDNAVKDRAKALRERDKLIEKRAKRAQKDQEKAAKEVAKEVAKQEKESLKEAAKREKEAQRDAERRGKQEQELQRAHEARTEEEHGAITEARALDAEKPRKLRQFCNLPGGSGGVRDPTWVNIFMDGVDEVGAHCGLFFIGPHYEKLVGDVGSRIVGWVQEDLTKRAILEMGQELD